MSASLRAAAPALAAALLFGASTPSAKLLVGQVPPLLLAGLLYLGSGFGLAAILALRAWRNPARTAWCLPRRDLGWLLAATFFGGMLGPALLMVGLVHAGAATAALLLNLEGVFTALIAWVVFRENTDRRIVVGMAAIVAGGALLSWQPGGATWSPGTPVIVAACLCWAVDNNLTRQVSSNDAMAVAAFKGLVAGGCNTALALAAGASLPPAPQLGASLIVGLLGYGVSLTLFVRALRILGTARTGAYFSVAPLFGVVVAFALWPELPDPAFWAASALMTVGVTLHLTERHDHLHAHEAIEHAHAHVHDVHHRHAHDFAWYGREPHAHPHRHEPLTHRHAHYPDIHHRHRHAPAADAAG